MKLDINEIVLNPGKRKTFDFEEPGFGTVDSEVCSDMPVKGSLEFTNAHGIIYAKGSFETELVLTCGRCLDNYRLKVSGDIEEVFPLGEDKADLSMDDPEFPLFKDNIVDISELLRQYVLLEVPVKPLCREDCKGLCQGCGANLNNSECTCTDGETYNPFSDILKDFD